MTELPSGTVTFLFTDIEGSTRLWEQHPAAMRDALARHDEILRDAVETRDGHVVKTTGDGLHASFASARNALAAAVDAQLALTAEDWVLPEPLLVRMGLHTGEAEVRAGDYYGPAVNRAARVSAAGHGGQILVSHATEELVRDDLPAGVGLVDLGEQRLRDLDRPERVFQVTHADLVADFAPVRSLDAYPTNLPAARTSFVGREREVADIATALASTRLVTLTGVGGVGKTRLALRVAAEVLPHRADGVWLCELAPVSESDAVLDAIANAVGAVPPQAGAGAGQPMLEVLVRRLARREVLLVVDNCEQVLAAAAEVVDAVLERCPGVSVLATSREGLGLPGERIVAVGSLAVPAADATPDVAASGDAVRLFVDRATAVRGDFVLRDDNVAAVVEVCRRLDGIPLAIELAAARTRMLTPADIAERLDERFRLLTGSVRGTVSRHQTLRAAIDWSYDQLDDAERTVLAGLAVFPADFDLAAAETVAVDGAVDATTVFDVMGQLVDKSLVVATETGRGMAFRLLETIRQYAEERLDDAGEIPAARSRHARHYLEVVELAASAPGAPFGQVAGDIAANVKAAHEWVVACSDADGALRLIVALNRLLGLRELPPIAAYKMVTDTLAIPAAMNHPLAPTVLAARANISLIASISGADPVAAFATAHRSLELADELGVRPGAEQLFMVAWVALRSGHFDDARDFARRSADAAGDGDDRAAHFAYFTLSAVERFAGNLDAAIEAGAQAEQFARRLGANDLVAGALLIQGYALVDVDPERALPLLDESARLTRQSSAGRQNLAHSLSNAGLLRLRLGDRAAARRDLTEVVDLCVRDEGNEAACLVVARVAIGLLDAGDDTDAASAAQLLAAAEVLDPGMSLYPGLGIDGAALTARLESVLGAEALGDLRRRGAAMDFDATIALARAAIDRVTDHDAASGA